MKKILFIFTLFFTLKVYADPITDVDRSHPFKDLFNLQLYDFSCVNEYDIDPLKRQQAVAQGTLLNESADQKIIRLEQRKLNRLNKKIILPINEYLLRLNPQQWSDPRTWKKLGTKGLAAVGSSLSLGYFFGKEAGGVAGEFVEEAAEQTARVVADAVDDVVVEGAKLVKVVAEKVEVVANGAGAGANTAGDIAAKGSSFNWGAAAAGVAANVGLNVLIAALDEGPERQKMVEGNLLIEELKQKVKNEDIKEQEEDYIRRQHDYDAEWRTTIEKALLKSRKEQSGLNTIDYVELVKDLTGFSTETKLLPPQYTLGDDDFVTKTCAFVDEAFKPNGEELSLNYYQGPVRNKLKRTLREICQCSKVAASNGPGQKRKSYLFYGIPGTGKSVAAQLLAKATDLPVYHLDIANRDDFSKASLYGSNSVINQSKGHLPQAFLTKNKHGERSKNIVVILDDVDRALPRDPATGRITDQDGLIAVLLKLLDRNTIKFKAAYYGIEEFDMSEIIFICTTNTDFSAAQHGDTFDALKSRARVIRFAPPGSEVKKQRIVAYLTDEIFADSMAFSDTSSDEWGNIRTAVANFIVDRYDLDDNREMERRAEDLLQEPQSAWEQVARDSGWRSNNAEPREQENNDSDSSDDEDD